MNKLLILCRLTGLILILSSCSQNLEEPLNVNSKGVPVYAEVEIEKNILAGETRVVTESNDNRTVVNFSAGDKVGMIAMQGIANPENEADFSFPANNITMNFEGRNGNYYKFGNSDYYMDPTSINEGYSVLYYPYCENMPDVKDTTPQVGLKIREHVNGIDKCIDFLHTSGNHIAVSEGVLKPSFIHEFFSLAIQRGEGFDDPDDPRIWVVMKNPYTDLVIKLRAISAVDQSTLGFFYDLKYNPDDDDLIVDLLGNNSKFQVNKHAVWPTWEGRPLNLIPTNYAILPPDDLFYILIQDNYGNWQNVSDFTLGTGKKGDSGTRYILTIKLQGTQVVVRPVYVENWDDEVSISDNRKVGIHDYGDYYKWVTNYNTYVLNDRDETLIGSLLPYGDASRKEGTNEIRWSFYINNDIDFLDEEPCQITRLEDTLEGSSTYTNFTINNLSTTMIGEIGESGVLNALDFKNLYIINPETKTSPSGAVTDKLNGGKVTNCDITNGVMIGWGVTGMVAGVVSGGEISNCSFSGDVIGNSAERDFNGLFGEIEGGKTPVVTESNFSGLKFIEN